MTRTRGPQFGPDVDGALLWYLGLQRHGWRFRRRALRELRRTRRGLSHDPTQWPAYLRRLAGSDDPARELLPSASTPSISRRRAAATTAARSAQWLLGALCLYAVLALAKQAYVTPFDSPGWQTWPVSAEIMAPLLVGMLASVLILHWASNRHRARGLVLVCVATLAFVCIVLGYAAYLPLDGEQVPVLAPTAWVLALFVGGVETTVIGPDSVLVPGGVPLEPGFQVARVFGLAATFVGAIAVATGAWRQQWERLRVRFGTDVDIVVGDETTSIALIRSLVQERRSRTRLSEWHRFGAARHVLGRTMLLPTRIDLARLWTARTRVVFVTRDPGAANLSLARAAGAVVIVADPLSPPMLTSLLLRGHLLRGRGVSVRRLYAVSSDQRLNIAVVDTAVARLGLPDVRRQHPLDVVPRLVARIDDPREARVWRNRPSRDETGASRNPRGRHFTDAVSVYDVLARQIVDVLVRPRPTEPGEDPDCRHLVLTGDGPVVLAVLDEIAWRRWERFDLLVSAGTAAASALAPEALPAPAVHLGDSPRRAVLERLAQQVEAHNACVTTPAPDDIAGAGDRRPFPIRRITVVGPRADLVVLEWQRTRAPWGTVTGGKAFDPMEPSTWSLEHQIDHDARDPRHAGGPRIEDIVRKLVRQGSDLLVADADPDLLSLAGRMASSFPRRTVLAPDETAEGIVARPGPGGVFRFGPTLTNASVVDGQDLSPEDSWAELARHQHTGFSAIPTFPGAARVLFGTYLDRAVIDVSSQPSPANREELLAWIALVAPSRVPEDPGTARGLSDEAVDLADELARAPAGPSLTADQTWTRRLRVDAIVAQAAGREDDGKYAEAQALVKVALRHIEDLTSAGASEGTDLAKVRERLEEDLGRIQRGQPREFSYSTKATGRPWDGTARRQLPAFFREENLRQLRNIVTWFADNGYRWEPTVVGTARAPVEPEAVGRCACAEHERWLAMRRRHGWNRGPRDDSRRLNPNVIPWDEPGEVGDRLRSWNTQQIRDILDRLYHIGLQPVPNATESP